MGKNKSKLSNKKISEVSIEGKGGTAILIDNLNAITLVDIVS